MLIRCIDLPLLNEEVISLLDKLNLQSREALIREWDKSGRNDIVGRLIFEELSC